MIQFIPTTDEVDIHLRYQMRCEWVGFDSSRAGRRRVWRGKSPEHEQQVAAALRLKGYQNVEVLK